jgi:hypothetical protein
MADQTPTSAVGGGDPDGAHTNGAKARPGASPASAIETAASIPVLTSIAACIFVPNTLDYSAPVPLQPADRLPKAIAELDRHAAAVRANMVALFEREHARIVRHAIEEERNLAAVGLTAEPTRASIVTELEEMDDMISNMEAPLDPAFGGTIQHIPPVQLPSGVGATSREWAANEVMRLTKAALIDLRVYDKHVSDRRSAYELALKRQLDRRSDS